MMTEKGAPHQIWELAFVLSLLQKCEDLVLYKLPSVEHFVMAAQNGQRQVLQREKC